MKKNIFLLLLNLAAFGGLLLNLNSCNTIDPPPEETKPTLTLELDDVSCTEAWLQITTNNIQLPTTINLLKNNSVTQSFSLSTQDSLFYIDSLLPNQNYSFQVSSIQHPVSSNELSVTTMDTTSHNFTFETFTFGQHSSSVLYDIAIINENDIWAVGEIYMNDSLGNPDPHAFNAIHWDGTSWELKRIMFYTICGQQSRTPYPAKAIFAFSKNDIWISVDGDQIARIENGVQTNIICLPSNVSMSINKIWGTSNNDLYIVGSAGNIAHYKNGSWTKIESGTTTDIQDILGYNDNFTNESDVYCAVSYVFQAGDRKIIHIKNNMVDSLTWLSDKRINSIWTSNNRFFFTAGDGVFENKRGYWNQVKDLPPYYSNNIRGNDLNDVFVCGDFGLLSHFNGSSWVTYNEHYMQGILFSIATKNNLVVTVGLNGSKATIIKGTSN
jgi:hypothetical protein